MTEKKPWQKDFNGAAEGILLKPRGGLDYLVGTYITQSDVTVISDNHLTSVSKYKDFLSENNLKKFANAGIAHIHVELPESVDDIRKKLADGQITKTQFVQELIDHKVFLMTVKDPIPIFNDIADAVINAKKNGIEFHFNQVAFTPEQNQAMGKFFKDNNDILKDRYANQSNEINTFLKDSGVSDIKRNRFIEKIKQPHRPFETISLERIDGKAFRDELTKPQIEILNEKIGGLRGILQDFENKKKDFTTDLLLKFRIGSDGELANRVATSLDHGGKALLLHGTLHGGTDKNDVDDLLAAKGLKVSRINLTYNAFDQDYNRALIDLKMMKDPSDVYYSPKRDSIELIDMNKDGLVDAGPAPPKAPIPHR